MYTPIQYYINQDLLDPIHDHDFTKEIDNGTVFRGGYDYRKPYGWYRYGLKVKGKYENDDWLGSPGPRIHSVQGEWPVSYHGTTVQNANNIANYGYQLNEHKCDRFMTGGVYQAPHIETAAQCATIFEFNGKRYQLVFQNRVSPTGLVSVPDEVTRKGEFWSQRYQGLTRPYGICIREC